MQNNNIDIEKSSSAATLSDMELFIFPELLYGLVLANIMSPRIWKWREDSWFKGVENMSPLRRIHRLKQYIINNYIFNLDLETWGLTTKKDELSRFKEIIDIETLKNSNALFGYEGEKYYFDIDIRRHFGLDKYTDEVIPYWKTETVEAMDSFSYKPGYVTGAGECVSLATLYAAALFIIARLPLQDIYLIATPLHSQNFMNVDNGVLTNNRRIVTKNMWFNGTPLSIKARRAIEKEKITIVAHETGYIHTAYDRYSISPESYKIFRDKLNLFTSISLSSMVFSSFLRSKRDVHKCFQVKWPIHGKNHYIGLERLFEYEVNYPYSFTDDTRKHLMDKIDISDFHNSMMPGRVIINELEYYLEHNDVDFSKQKDLDGLKEKISQDCVNSEKLIKMLIDFCITKPDFPVVKNKMRVSSEPLGITLEMNREEIIKRFENIRMKNKTVDLAFYAFRDLRRTDPVSFLIAALKRNPVCVEALKNKNIETVIMTVENMEEHSIYDEEYRMAQPDEVWNFQRGDGLEKALLIASIAYSRDMQKSIKISMSDSNVDLLFNNTKIRFSTSKRIGKQIWNISSAGIFIDKLIAY